MTSLFLSFGNGALASKGLGLAGALLAAWFAVKMGNRWFRQLERGAARVAQKKMLVIVGIAAGAILLRLALLPVAPLPVPVVQDEFSYLLAADTFAHARLTNPTHPMWVYLDTMHVNQRPTYMSKYPPGQGAALAAGQILGHPWIGVLLSVGAMCAAIAWMLQGWFPPVWALLGAVFAVVRLALFSYWVDSYWGGAVAAVGGALVVGAVPRLVHRERPRDAFLLGLGFAILANSRPLEGAIFCLPVVLALLWWGFKSQGWRQGTLRNFLAPLAAVLLVTGIFLCYYNWRGTGNPLLLPYALNEQAHSSRPLFVWQKLRSPIQFANPQFDYFYNHTMRSELSDLQDHFIGTSLKRGETLLSFFTGMLAPALLLLTLPQVLRDKRTRLLAIQVAVSGIGLLVVAPFFAHYAAPMTATIMALMVQGMRHLRQWEYAGRPVGVGLTRGIALLVLALVPLDTAKAIHAAQAHFPKDDPSMYERARIAAQLEGATGQHLVIVRYGSRHQAHDEWVYNASDIDHSKIVWAREIPGKDLQPLLDYFKDRRVWLAEADTQPAKLRLYQPGSDRH